MSSTNLYSRLRKEVAESPAKAVVLAVVLVGAVWWISSSAKSKKTALKAVATADDFQLPELPVALMLSGGGSSQQGAIWRRSEQWRRETPETLSATSLEPNKNPFRADKKWKPVEQLQLELSQRTDSGDPTGKTAVSRIGAQHLKSKNPSFEFSDLPLRLAGAITGRSAMATINGKIYQRGDAIRVSRGGQGTQDFVFQLTEIHSQHVILQREGKAYWLGLLGDKRGPLPPRTARPYTAVQKAGDALLGALWNTVKTARDSHEE